MHAFVRPLRDTDYHSARHMFNNVFDMCEDTHFVRAWKRRDVEKSLGVWYDTNTLAAVAVVTDGNMLAYIFVDPYFQKKGYGTTLLRAVLDTSPSLRLVPVNNDDVIRWYESHGFKLSRRSGDRSVYVRRAYLLRSRPMTSH